MTVIDLNSDVGELPRLQADGSEDTVIAAVSSVNIACGGHAGDVATMEAALRSALRHGAAVGAHPGYPDRQGFGRRELAVEPEAVRGFVLEQLLALREVAERVGCRLGHVKPHGALYHAAGRTAAIARAIGEAVLEFDPTVVMVGQAGSPMLAHWSSLGLRAVGEAFADRLYEADGSLRSRAHADALLTNPADAAAQALRIALGQGVVARGGVIVPVMAQTLCLHGDTPGAAALARAVRSGLEAAGVKVAAVSAGGRGDGGKEARRM